MDFETSDDYIRSFIPLESRFISELKSIVFFEDGYATIAFYYLCAMIVAFFTVVISVFTDSSSFPFVLSVFPTAFWGVTFLMVSGVIWAVMRTYFVTLPYNGKIACAIIRKNHRETITSLRRGGYFEQRKLVNEFKNEFMENFWKDITESFYIPQPKNDVNEQDLYFSISLYVCFMNIMRNGIGDGGNVKNFYYSSNNEKFAFDIFMEDESKNDAYYEIDYIDFLNSLAALLATTMSDREREKFFDGMWDVELFDEIPRPIRAFMKTLMLRTNRPKYSKYARMDENE